ncbi:MAG: C-terminal binding protein [Planctomycetes bacterium]|nr:C-terminal binding protein [Planctomycetota bacterium]
MFKVRITDYLTPPVKIEEDALAGLAAIECLMSLGPDDLVGRINDSDGVILYHQTSIPRRVIDVLDRCKVIVRGGVGFDAVDLEAAGKKGIIVCNVPDYGVDEVADHAIALMMACNRGLLLADRRLRSRLEPWDYHSAEPVFRLSEATIGVVGLGRIGTATALRAKALKMRVLACDPYLRPGIEKAIGVERVDLGTLLATSDVVSLHVPLTDETRHMINAATLAKMKPGALLINTARGDVVNVDDLADAIESRRIGGAGIDVLPTEPPPENLRLIKLWRRTEEPFVNLVITAHCAFYSESAFVEVRTKAVQEVARVLRGEKPLNCVNCEFLKT